MGKSKDINIDDLSEGESEGEEYTGEEYDCNDFNESKHGSFEVKIKNHSKLKRHSNNLFNKNKNINIILSDVNFEKADLASSSIPKNKREVEQVVEQLYENLKVCSQCKLKAEKIEQLKQ